MSDIGEKRLVLYAQMANLVNLILPSLEINIKEITQNFSKVYVIIYFIVLYASDTVFYWFYSSMEHKFP